MSKHTVNTFQLQPPNLVKICVGIIDAWERETLSTHMFPLNLGSDLLVRYFLVFELPMPALQIVFLHGSLRNRNKTAIMKTRKVDARRHPPPGKQNHECAG